MVAAFKLEEAQVPPAFPFEVICTVCPGQREEAELLIVPAFGAAVTVKTPLVPVVHNPAVPP
jgi:hypothetical protein